MALDDSGLLLGSKMASRLLVGHGRYLRSGYANPNGAFFQIRLRQNNSPFDPGPAATKVLLQ
jgi:hypothetical protein